MMMSYSENVTRAVTGALRQGPSDSSACSLTQELAYFWNSVHVSWVGQGGTWVHWCRKADSKVSSRTLGQGEKARGQLKLLLRQTVLYLQARETTLDLVGQVRLEVSANKGSKRGAR
jgi:hypothetical protein